MEEIHQCNQFFLLLSERNDFHETVSEMIKTIEVIEMIKNAMTIIDYYY